MRFCATILTYMRGRLTRSIESYSGRMKLSCASKTGNERVGGKAHWSDAHQLWRVLFTVHEIQGSGSAKLRFTMVLSGSSEADYLPCNQSGFESLRSACRSAQYNLVRKVIVQNKLNTAQLTNALH